MTKKKDKNQSPTILVKKHIRNGNTIEAHERTNPHFCSEKLKSNPREALLGKCSSLPRSGASSDGGGRLSLLADEIVSKKFDFDKVPLRESFEKHGDLYYFMIGEVGYLKGEDAREFFGTQRDSYLACKNIIDTDEEDLFLEILTESYNRKIDELGRAYSRFALSYFSDELNSMGFVERDSSSLEAIGLGFSKEEAVVFIGQRERNYNTRMDVSVDVDTYLSLTHKQKASVDKLLSLLLTDDSSALVVIKSTGVKRLKEIRRDIFFGSCKE